MPRPCCSRRARMRLARVNAPVYRRGDAPVDVNVAIVYAPVRRQRPFIGRHCLYALLIILIPRNFPYAYAPLRIASRADGSESSRMNRPAFGSRFPSCEKEFIARKPTVRFSPLSFLLSSTWREFLHPRTPNYYAGEGASVNKSSRRGGTSSRIARLLSLIDLSEI